MLVRKGSAGRLVKAHVEDMDPDADPSASCGFEGAWAVHAG